MSDMFVILAEKSIFNTWDAEIKNRKKENAGRALMEYPEAKVLLRADWKERALKKQKQQQQPMLLQKQNAQPKRKQKLNKKK